MGVWTVVLLVVGFPLAALAVALFIRVLLYHHDGHWH